MLLEVSPFLVGRLVIFLDRVVRASAVEEGQEVPADGVSLRSPVNDSVTATSAAAGLTSGWWIMIAVGVVRW